jgi:phosphatidylglycerol---prolipoprotein diacylglyceryl transferase
MLPILLKLGPLTIHTYGLLMAVGVGFGLWFLYVQASKQGLDAPKLLDAAFYTIIVSLIGAKLILFIGNFSYYMSYPKELFSLARSGGVFQGGLTFGLIFALWYFRRKKIPTWKAGDIVSAALALGHGFGRIGCFAAGCCYGSPCAVPWGVTFHNEYAHDLTGIPIGERLHPVQLYESILNFLNFFVLFMVLKRKKFHGQVFGLYIINYSVIRFIVEYFRGDHPDRAYLLQGPTPLSSLSYPQVYCILGIAAGIIFSLIMKKRKGA